MYIYLLFLLMYAYAFLTNPSESTLNVETHNQCHLCISISRPPPPFWTRQKMPAAAAAISLFFSFHC